MIWRDITSETQKGLLTWLLLEFSSRLTLQVNSSTDDIFTITTKGNNFSNVLTNKFRNTFLKYLHIA